MSHQLSNSLSASSNHGIFSHLVIPNEIRCSLDPSNKCGTSAYSEIIISNHKTIRYDTPQQAKFRQSKVGDLNASAGGHPLIYFLLTQRRLTAHEFSWIKNGSEVCVQDLLKGYCPMSRGQLALAYGKSAKGMELIFAQSAASFLSANVFRVPKAWRSIFSVSI